MLLNLKSCPLFINVPENEIESLFQKVIFQIRTYYKNTLIVQSGDPVDNLMIVLKGSVRGEMINFTGKTLKIEDVAQPMPIAIAFVFGNQNVYPVNLIANEEAVLMLIPKSSVLQLFQMNQHFLKNFLDAVSGKAQFLSNRIKFLSFQKIDGKVAHYLLQKMTSSHQNEILLEKSHSELADFFGVTRPSLSRVFRDMTRKGYIETNGKRIKIIDRNALSQLLR